MDSTNDEWKEKLTPEQYHILREKGTEPAFTGKYYDHKKDGMYRCAACGAELFASDAKLAPGTEPAGLQGWPSFDQALPGAVEYKEDTSLGMNRTEAVCAQCGGHLGHIFDDPKEKTGKHLCINSCSLNFESDTE